MDELEHVEEIVVTARRRSETLQSVPVAVTAFGEAQLKRSEVRNLSDLSGLSPNTSIDLLGVTPGAAGITIRGVGLTDLDKTFDPAVGVVLDGVYIATPTSALLNNFDFESVEILRGPQGTLFGRNTTGGVINVRRTRPTGELGLRAGVTLATLGRHDYKLVGNFPIVRKALAGKLSFYSLNQRGAIQNVYNGESQPDQHYLSGSADLLYTPTKNASVHIKYERIRDRAIAVSGANASDQTDLICYGPPLNLTTFDDPQCADPHADKFKVNTNFPNFMHLDLDAVTLNADLQLDHVRLVSVSGFRGHDEDLSQDFDSTPRDFYSTRRTQRYDQLSEELRVEGKALQRVAYVAGLYYFYSHLDLNGSTFFLFDQPILHQLIGPKPPGTVRVQDMGQSTHSVASFASVDVDVVDNLRASLGGRFTYDYKQFENDLGYSNHLDSEAAREQEAMDNEPRVHAHRGWQRFTPKAGLDYTIDDRVLGDDNEGLLYASYAQGFKAGGFDGRADPAATTSYDPERVDTYEAGLKTAWLGNRLVFNTAAFYIDYRDKQEQMFLASPTGGQQTLTRNAAHARITGLEFEASAMPLHGHSAVAGNLRLWGNVGLLKAEYLDFVVDFNGPTLRGDLEPRSYKGLEMRNAPPLQFAVGVASPWEIQRFGRLLVNAQYRQRARRRDGYTMTGDNVTTPEVEKDGPLDSRGVMPALRLLDASITLEVDDLMYGSFRVTAFARNILNQTPQQTYVDVSDLFAVKSYGSPSQFGVELAATF